MFQYQSNVCSECTKYEFNFQDTAGFSEELSVKTLANMFDFRLSDPSMTKNLHKLIKESKIDAKCCTPQPLPTIDVDTCSEC